ncbi:ATP-dependent RNA helicase SUV3 [Biscogniauxia mediterranea]|nr:ATP-dependent RNA helicase SUV3 [Biscogniauxia mediterranea]
MRSFLRSAPASSSWATFIIRRHAFSTSSRTARVKSASSPPRKHRGPGPHRGKESFGGFGAFNSQLDKFKGDVTSGHPREAIRTYNIFRKLVLGEYDRFMKDDWTWRNKKDNYSAFGINSQSDLDREAKLFRNSIERACDIANQKNVIDREGNPLFWSLRSAFIEGDRKGLDRNIETSFYNFLMRSRFPKNIAATHRAIADFRYPYEWFPATRALQRTVHLHVGPTNSGKTYRALKALENAKSGIYAGPLRLLAHEVYSRFMAKGKQCALITGEEQRIPDEDNYFRSCTVEMTPLNSVVDVAVIDEIQMIGDPERGWAWTQAFLGVQAKEVHLCGEERAVKLIQSLCATIGDTCVVHKYERLSGLKTMSESLRGSWAGLQKGDAVVSFSRIGIHGLKKEIESQTGKRCAVVYGSLPPETRAQQAALFNDPNSDFDFLVASDAIGMGLNLEIRRVIFEQTHKRQQNGFRQLTVSEIKQIGGRAGRYRTANHAIQSATQEDSNENAAPPPKSKSVGLVTAWDDEDLAVIIKAFNREAETIKTAGIQPPPSVIERFSSYFPPNTPFSYILVRLREIARLSPQYHLCSLKEMLEIADLIQPFSMTVYDRCVFLNAPVNIRERSGQKVLQAFAKCVSDMDGGHILDIPELDLDLLDIDKNDYPGGPSEYLRQLESLHKAITLYLWLSYRYSGVFHSQGLAFHVKKIVEDKIDAQLSEVSFTADKRKARLEAIRKSAEKRKKKKREVLGDNVPIDEGSYEGPGEWKEEGHQEPLFNDPSELEQITRVQPGTEKATSV